MKEDKDQGRLLHNQYIGNGQTYYFKFKDQQIQIRREQVYWIQTHQEKITRLLGMLSTDNLVDLGCGEGYFTLPLSLQSKFCIGFDIQPSMLEIINKQADFDPDKFCLVNSSADAIPLDDKCVDKLLCNHVLEHVINDDIVVQEIYRVLRDGGRLLTGIPLEMSPQMRILIKLRRFLRPKSGQLVLERAQPGELMPELIGKQMHIRFYSLKAFINLLERNGFHILHVEGIGLSVPHQFQMAFRQSRVLFKVCTALSTRIPSIGDGVLVLAEKE